MLLWGLRVHAKKIKRSCMGFINCGSEAKKFEVEKHKLVTDSNKTW